MTNETFSDRLKLAMQAKQFKQVDLIRAAQRRGVKLGKSHVSQYVSGKTVPRSDILHFLADVLQVDPDWLLAKDSTVNYTADTVSDPAESFSDPSAASLSQTKTGGSPMREFKKSSKLDNVLYDVRGPVVEEANRMEACGTQVLKLNIGNPAPFGFRTPDEVIYDMSHQLTDCEGYSPSQGLFSARKAIMQYAQLKKLPNVSIDDIYTGNGVSELINLCMSALLDDGDEISSHPRITRSGPPAQRWPVEKPSTTSAMNSPNGIRTSMICEKKSPTAQKRSLLSIRITRPVHSIRKRYCSRLSISPESIS